MRGSKKIHNPVLWHRIGLNSSYTVSGYKAFFWRIPMDLIANLGTMTQLLTKVAKSIRLWFSTQDRLKSIIRSGVGCFGFES